MDPVIFGTITTISGVALGAAAKEVVKDCFERRRVGRANTPNVCGTWKAEWFDDSGGADKIYTEDTVQIETQRGVRIEGHGNEPTLGRYTLAGQFNSHGVVTLTYDFREKANAIVGVVLLQVTPDLRNARATGGGSAALGRSSVGVPCGQRRHRQVPPHAEASGEERRQDGSLGLFR